MVTPLELAVAQVSAKGTRREWRFNPLWVRLQRKEDEEYGLESSISVSRGRELEVGSFLVPMRARNSRASSAVRWPKRVAGRGFPDTIVRLPLFRVAARAFDGRLRAMIPMEPA